MRPAILLALLFGLGCNTPTTASASKTDAVPGEMARSGETLETVNGQPVTQSMLDAVLRTMPADQRAEVEASPAEIEGLKQQIVTQEVLYQEAVKQNLHQDEVVQLRLTMAARDAMIESLLRKAVEERADDAAVQAWYTDHLVQFRQKQVNVSHIVVKEEAAAQAAFAEASAAGADFAAAAKKHSIDPSAAQNGGELGWMGERELAGPLGEAAFAAEVGQVVGPIQSPYGFHVIKVNDARDMIPLEDIKDQILPQVQQEVATAYVSELRDAAVAGSAGAAGADDHAGHDHAEGAGHQ